MNRLTLTVAEAAEVLGVSRRLIYDAVNRGELKAISIGRRLVIPRVAVEQMLGQQIETVSA